MNGDHEKAGRCHDRAEQLRTLASAPRDRGAKSNPLGLIEEDAADDYDRMARTFGPSTRLTESPETIADALPIGGAKK